MKTVRLLLLLVAGAIVFSVAMILRRESERTPQSVLSQARAMVALEAPNFNGAFLTIEQGLGSLEDEYSSIDLAPLVLERMRVYRARWDGSQRDHNIAHEPGDLRQVLLQAYAYLEHYDSGNSKAIFLGTQAALELGELEQATDLAQRLLESSPAPRERARGYRSLGTIELVQAERSLEPLLEAQPSASPEQHEARLEHARQVALLHASYPSEEAALNNYMNALPEELSRLASECIGAAAKHFTIGKAQFLRALELHPDEPSVVELQTLALQAKAFNEVIDIGLMALSREALFPSTPILSLTLQAMHATSREQEALGLLAQRSKLIKTIPLDYSPLNDADLNRLCLLLVELDDPLILDTAARELRARPGDLESSIDYKRLGYFYTLLARVGRGSVFNIAPVIAKGKPASDYYEGQLMEYWSAAAATSRMRDRESESRRYLSKATRLAPLDPASERMRTVTGGMWEEEAKAIRRSGNYRAAENAFANALRFPVKDRAGLSRTFDEVGEEAMQARGRTSKSIRMRPAHRGRQGLYPEMGPWEACFRAGRCIDLNQAGEVLLILGPTLNAYPGLPQALELMARAELVKGEPLLAIEFLLEIEERGLASPASRALLDGIPAEHFGGMQLRRLLQATPGDSTLMALLLRCKRLGQQDRLLAMLNRVRQSELPAPALLLGVEVHLDQRDTLAAFKLYQLLTPEARKGGQSKAPGLRLAAALLSEPKYKRRGDKLLAELFRERGWKPEGLEAGVDLLLAHGHIDLAREALDRADSGKTPLSPSLLLRWAWSGALAGQAALDSEALEAFSRAEPYLRSGQGDFTRLLMDLDAGKLEDLPHWAGLLLNSEFAGEDIQRALLLALSNDLPKAATVIARLNADSDQNLDGRTSLAIKTILAAGLAADASGDEPAWLHGPDGVWYSGDLREPMVMLLAAQAPPFAAWVLARQRDMPKEQRSSPLNAVVSACAWRSLGDLERADQALKSHTKSADSQPEAWLMREELALASLDSNELGHASDSVALLEQLRQKRLMAQGPLGDSAAQVTLLRARKLKSSGRTQEAAIYIEKIRQIWPDDPELLLELARLARSANALPQSFALYIELFDKHGQHARGVLPEVLALLESQVAAGELSREAQRARLQSFQALLPDHPALPLALAEMQLENKAGDSAWNAERALDVLNRFRSANAPRSLESLSPGATIAWVKLLSRLDQPAALKLAQAELDSNPERVELWRLWLDTLVVGGELGTARRTHESIQSIFNDNGLRRSFGLLLLDSRLLLPDALRRSLNQMAKEDPEVKLFLNLNVLAGKGSQESKNKARLASLAHWEARGPEALESAQTARLLLRGLGAKDASLSAILRSAQRETRDPHLRDLFSILLQLHAFPVQQEEAGA